MARAFSETLVEARHLGRGVLFERVDHFSFVHGRTAGMLVRSVTCGSVTIATVRSTGHDITLEEFGRATFLAPLVGTLGIEAAGSMLGCGSGGGLFLRPGRRDTAVRAPKKADFLGAVVTAPAMAVRRAGSAPGIAVEDAETDPSASALRGYLRYFVREFPRPGSPLQRPGALLASEALILDLITEMEGFDVEPATRFPATSADRVRVAEEYMRAHSDEPLTVEGIARMVGVGARALQLAFHTHRGVSPRKVLANFRLERTRDRLATAEPDLTVSDVALLSGFAHLGRFAASYRARFGEMPSETLRQKRR